MIRTPLSKDAQVGLSCQGPSLRKNKLHKENVFTFQSLIIDFQKRTVTAEGKQLKLTPKEFELLETLITHPRQIFSRKILLDRIWGYDFLGDPRTVDTHLKSLRAKLGIYGNNLVTQRGVGYHAEFN